MLVDRLNEQKLDFTYPDGYRHEAALAPFKERLAAASVYILDANAVAMACNVAYSKPSSIIASLPWVRLPFKSVFIEFANSHLREASAAIGSPNVRPPNTMTQLVRSGFLITESDGELTMEYASEQTTPDNRTLIDLAPVRGMFTLRGAELPEPSDRVVGSVPPNTRGKVRDHIKLITTDPYEHASYLNLHERFSWMPHPDMTHVASNLRRMKNQAAVNVIEENQANEMYRLFVGAILPALILINCRNAVAIEHIPAPDKLNKARARKGKPPIREHHEIHLNLSSARRRAMQVGLNGTRIPVASLVAGHFKVRKTGIFYWNSHTRLGGGDGPTKVHRVSA